MNGLAGQVVLGLLGQALLVLLLLGIAGALVRYWWRRRG